MAEATENNDRLDPENTAPRPRKGARHWRKVPAPRGVVVVNEACCLGCRTCEVVCSLYHEGVVSPELSRILVVKDWTRPNTIDVEFEPILCEQCADAPCLQSCPTGAIKIDQKTNARVVDMALCIGCHDCEKACPYTPSRIRFNKAQKALTYVSDDRGITWTGYPVIKGV